MLPRSSGAARVSTALLQGLYPLVSSDSSRSPRATFVGANIVLDIGRRVSAAQ